MTQKEINRTIEQDFKDDNYTVLETYHHRTLHFLYTLKDNREDIILVVHRFEWYDLQTQTNRISRGDWGSDVLEKLVKNGQTIPPEWVDKFPVENKHGIVQFLHDLEQTKQRKRTADSLKAPEFKKGDVWYSKDPKGIPFRDGAVYRRFKFHHQRKRSLPRFETEDEAIVYFSREYLAKWNKYFIKLEDPERETEFLLEYY